MNGESAAPGDPSTALPERRISKQERCESSAFISVRNSIFSEPKSYDELQEDVRSSRPRLLPEAIDHALGLLIQRRAIWVSEQRWAARVL